MASGIALTDSEIEEITKKKRYGAQQRQLLHLGITHKIRGDGSILVFRAHVNGMLGAEDVAQPSFDPEPNWSAISGTS